MAFSLAGITLREGETCQICGTGIRWVWELRGEGVLCVGSECAKALLGGADHAEPGDVMERRAKRAARQWRAQNPPPRAGEGKAAYVARRIEEMGNAWAAHLAYEALPPLHVHALRVNMRAKRLFGIWDRDRYIPFGAHALDERRLTRIERTFRAERSDFLRSRREAKKI